MVDVLGLILGIFISAANESDSQMAPSAASQLKIRVDDCAEVGQKLA
jgi:hypothetical protein